MCLRFPPSLMYTSQRRLYLILLSYRLQLVLISFSLESFFIIPLSISLTSASRGYIYQNWVLFSLLSCHALLIWSRYANTSTILRESLDGDDLHRGFVQVHFSQYGEPPRLEYTSQFGVYSRWYRSGSFYLDVQTILLCKKKILKSYDILKFIVLPDSMHRTTFNRTSFFYDFSWLLLKPIWVREPT